PALGSHSSQPDTRRATAFALLWGVLVSHVIRGYQFGRGNHHVYLLDALRINDPTLLQNDWWTANTLQYHWVFSYVAAVVMRVGIAEVAFLLMHAATVVLLHLAWWRIVRTLRGDLSVYVVSVLLYHALGGGFGLGLYAFLQDSSFLPSNAAAVALLWGVAFWLVRRDVAAGVCVGVAGVWHLNYAVVGVGAWGIYLVWRLAFTRDDRRTLLIATGAAWLPCLANIVPALVAKAYTDDLRIPLNEYVDLYVKLRHPHHYDPGSWPVALWVAFLLPVPMAWRAWKTLHRSLPRRRGVALVLAAGAVLLVALFGAGIFWTSGTLIQMSLWRFSVFPKLLLCVAAALWIVVTLRPTAGRAAEKAAAWAVAIGIPVVGLVLLLLGVIPRDQTHTGWAVLACIAAGVPIALQRWAWAVPGVVLMLAASAWNGTAARPDEPALREVAAWAEQATSVDAVFVVPPSASGFRLDARRAAVVTFKHVPQLSGEMRTWRAALQDVLAIDDLTAVPGDFNAKQAWMDERYRQRPLTALLDVASKHDATHVIAPPTEPPTDDTQPAFVSGDGRWAVYVVERDGPDDSN
ncbi:MAG: DUF6798 domain-containing protein, partial [Planctomycetota bacterium]